MSASCSLYRSQVILLKTSRGKISNRYGRAPYHVTVTDVKQKSPSFSSMLHYTFANQISVVKYVRYFAIFIPLECQPKFNTYSTQILRTQFVKQQNRHVATSPAHLHRSETCNEELESAPKKQNRVKDHQNNFLRIVWDYLGNLFLCIFVFEVIL